MQNTGLDGSQARIMIAGRNINNLRWYNPMAESEEELKRLLMNVKEESKKAGLKLNIQTTKVMASGPTTSWKIEGEKVETVKDIIFLGSKITADGDYSHKIKRHLLLEKSVTNPDSILKGRNFADKGSYIQSYGFSSSLVQMWELDHKEGWVPNNWCFDLQCWRRLLRVPWTARISKPVNPKGNQPEYSLEGLMLKLQSFGHLMWKVDPLEKTLKLGKIEGRRRRGQQRIRWLDSITDSMEMILRKLQVIVEDKESWHAGKEVIAVHGVTNGQTWLSD